MIDDCETRLKQMYIELDILEYRISNHIDASGNNILEKFPYLIKLPTPLVGYFKNANFIRWLETNIEIENYIHPWPDLIYFKYAEDAIGFKLRWI